LASRGEENLPAGYLLGALWPDLDSAAAEQRLRLAVSRARAVLEPPRAPTRITESPAGYKLILRDGDQLDTRRFLTTAIDPLALDEPHRWPAVTRALALWGGEPLPEDRDASCAAHLRAELIQAREALERALDRGQAGW
jgi:DNA-binding SARP family transcriptional activator